MIHQILVPLDTSTLAESALPHVEAIARTFGARVHLISVIESQARPSQTIDSVDWRLTRDEREAYLERVATSLATTGLEVSWEATEGTAAERILQAARSHEADLLVLTTHGEGGISDFRLSGTVSKVVSGAEVSLLLVRPDEGRESVEYRKILIPVDCSPRGDWSVCLAAQVAQTHGAELLLVTVIEPPDLLGGPQQWSEQTKLARRLAALNRGVAERHVRGLAERLAGGEIAVTTRVIESPHASNALKTLAGEEDCSLVVLSAHGRTPEAGWPYGSVTRGLIEHCEQPILVFQDARAADRAAATGGIDRHEL